MIADERNENFKEEEVPQEINEHVKFLTDHIKMSAGGEDAIFKHDPLNKKPGANYVFNELSELEQRLMQDNANEFEKKILYQHINKVANMPRIQEAYNEHPEYLYYMECS